MQRSQKVFHCIKQYLVWLASAQRMIAHTTKTSRILFSMCQDDSQLRWESNWCWSVWCYELEPINQFFLEHFGLLAGSIFFTHMHHPRRAE
jgi:hypothetical protein